MASYDGDWCLWLISFTPALHRPTPMPLRGPNSAGDISMHSRPSRRPEAMPARTARGDKDKLPPPDTQRLHWKDPRGHRKMWRKCLVDFDWQSGPGDFKIPTISLVFPTDCGGWLHMHRGLLETSRTQRRGPKKPPKDPQDGSMWTRRESARKNRTPVGRKGGRRPRRPAPRRGPGRGFPTRPKRGGGQMPEKALGPTHSPDSAITR